MPTPTIETEHLLMRPFCVEDLDALTRILSKPEVMRYIADGQPRSQEQTRATLQRILQHWERYGFGWWALVYTVDNCLAGWGGLKRLDEELPEVEVLYMLDTPYWGKGLATEAAQASLRYGFETLKLDRIVALAYPENLASQRVMEKIGMHYEKTAGYHGIIAVWYAITSYQFQPGRTRYTVY